MSENFGYIDIILLAIMAGFILLRLRSTLGKGADNMPMKARFTQSQSNDEFVKSSLKDEPRQDLNKFDEKTFITGAEAAYEIIINAFAKGDRKILKPLLTKDLYQNFDSVIKDRAEKKISSDMTFIGIKETKVLDIHIEGSVHNVKTRFVSEIVNSLKNDKGDVIEGDPEQIKIVTDVWVFKKDLKNSDPTWYLTELSSEEETKH
ncbi:MAG: preprotein translocase subunit Tim44 [Pelagibacteraceae bacterium TMED136]|nr:MAG: preprotein translocase subunit Tim44 [Pelagibacteraceae bacterium TMED136]|tara:strand:+ start:110 stop:724 length:615 start_codon:yes stop_codon:yes gene_type:complete